MTTALEPVELAGAGEKAGINVGQTVPLSASKSYTGQNNDSEDEYDEKNPFTNPIFATHWKEVYEDSKYECRHVFDPTFTWTPEEEKALIRKLDWRVCLWACVMFMSLQSS